MIDNEKNNNNFLSNLGVSSLLVVTLPLDFELDFGNRFGWLSTSKLISDFSE